jgi:cytochrome c2
VKIGSPSPAVAAAALLALVAACGGAPPRDGSSAAAGEASTLVSHKCTKCHAPPERGKHTAAELEEVFGRHRTRVKLTNDQWESIVALLARDADDGHGFR